MIDLEQRLRQLGEALDYPPTPALAVRIGAHLRSRPRHGGQRTFAPTRLALAAAAVVLLVAGALAAIPATRNAVAGWLGLRGVLIQSVPSLPAPTPAGPNQSLGDRLSLGRRVSLEQARAAVPYHLLLPQSLGAPDQVYLMAPPDAQGVALVYLPRPGLPETAHTGVGALVIEFPGRVPDYFEKMIGPGATMAPVPVNGTTGYWISGKPHGFIFLDAQGNGVDDTFRLAGNTLLWTQGTLTLRIEADLTEQQALATAGSMR